MQDQCIRAHQLGRGVMLAARFSALVAAFVVSAAAVAAADAPRPVGTKAAAVAMVKRVQEKFKKDGPEATFAAISNREPAFHDRDLYPFVYRLDGVNVAHGARRALVGKNLLNIKDPDGVPLIREMVRLAREQGSGWVNYKWPNPITNAIEDKTSYIERMGDYFVGVGVYRP